MILWLLLRLLLLLALLAASLILVAIKHAAMLTVRTATARAEGGETEESEASKRPDDRKNIGNEQHCAQLRRTDAVVHSDPAKDEPARGKEQDNEKNTRNNVV